MGSPLNRSAAPLRATPLIILCGACAEDRRPIRDLQDADLPISEAGPIGDVAVPAGCPLDPPSSAEPCALGAVPEAGCAYAVCEGDALMAFCQERSDTPAIWHVFPASCTSKSCGHAAPCRDPGAICVPPGECAGSYHCVDGAWTARAGADCD